MTLKGFCHNRKGGGRIEGLRSWGWKDSPILSASSESELISSYSKEAKDPWQPEDALKFFDRGTAWPFTVVIGNKKRKKSWGKCMGKMAQNLGEIE
jgi:hypothetical protein